MKEKEGIPNPYLMAQNDVVNIENSSDFTFEELFEAFNELMDEYKKVGLKNKELKSLNISLAEEKNKILIEKKN